MQSRLEIYRSQEQQKSRHRIADSKLMHCEMLPSPFSDTQLGVSNLIYVGLFPHKQVYKPRVLNLRSPGFSRFMAYSFWQTAKWYVTQNM